MLRIRTPCFGSWKCKLSPGESEWASVLAPGLLGTLPVTVFKIMIPTETMWGIFSGGVGDGPGQ